MIAASVVTATEIAQLVGHAADRRLPRDIRDTFAERVVALARKLDPSVDRLRTAVFHTRLPAAWQTESTNVYIHPAFVTLWIPLVDAVVEAVELGALPPAIASELRGRHSIRVVERDGHTMLLDSARRRRIVVDSSILDHAAIRVSTPGDALAMRPDVLHRGSAGLAISFRVIDSRAVVTRERLIDMGAIKFDSMARMRVVFARRLATFQIARRDSLSVADFDAIYDELETREKATCKRLGVDQLPNVAFEDLVYELTTERG
ncbi:MAG TPA: hypothetical protein VGO00_20045 [Kofleriaceae bacterium]|nr:hypothetical protein [Kofleriaceae bacterium]